MKKAISIFLALFLLPVTALAAPAFTVSQGGTGTGTPWSKYPLTGNGLSALIASSSPWVVGINATGTSDALASTFVRARLTFSTTTNATTTNFFTSLASTTNFWGGGLPGTGCTGASSFIQWSAGLFSCGTPAGSIGVWGTTSADYYHSQFGEWSLQGSPIYLAPTTSRAILVNFSTSTVTNLLVVNGTTTNATTTFFNVQNSTHTSSTTLQNFTALQSTSTIATTTSSFATTASSTNLYTSNMGVASNTPFYALSVGQGTGSSSAAILVAENREATSSTMTIDWKTGNSSLVRIGNAALTINFTNYSDGGQKLVTVCNPGAGTAGAITWGTQVLWTAGTVPTQTTTANKCDVYSFKATNATSSLKIFGAATANF